MRRMFSYFGKIARLRGLSFCAVLMMAPLGVSAQDLLSGPVGGILVINQERVFSESIFGDRITKDLEQARNALVQENRQIEADLSTEEQTLTKQRAAMDPDAFRILAEEFDAKVQDIRRAQDAKSRELSRLRDLERQKLLNLILPILAELMNERGAVAILDRRAVFVASDSVDVTEELIARINASIGDGLRPQDPTTAPPAETPSETPAEPAPEQ